MLFSPDQLEKTIKQTGGRFRLTSLIQKRARELCLGAPRLAEVDSDRPHAIAFAEVEEEKIYAMQPEELETEQEQEEEDES